MGTETGRRRAIWPRSSFRAINRILLQDRFFQIRICFNNWEETSDHRTRYGRPAIVLWKRTSAGFRWLAYRTMKSKNNDADNKVDDGIVTYDKESDAWRLVNWSTLMVRVAEGYSLAFSSGGGLTSPGVPIIETLDRTSSARLVMTPILTGGSWTNRNAVGTFVLANIVTGTTAIATNVPLYVNGVRLATATGGIVNTKKNYLRVYFSDPTARGKVITPVIETDNNRLANPRGSVNWPPDDLTDLAASTDYVTLVQWTGYQTGISAFTSTSEPNAIIVDSDLTTPTWTSTSTYADFAGDSISLSTSSDNALSTYYDDFAIQLDQKAGTGFLPPIQQ
jgi:hypothetical protein